MEFEVRSMCPGGREVRQQNLIAPSEAALRARLLGEGHVVFQVRRIGGTMKPRRRFDVAWWCRELRTLLRSGMTVVEALETLAVSAQGGDRDTVHQQLLMALREGKPLSRAMAGMPEFPAVLVAAVTASERTSTLVEALDDYLRYDEVLQRLRRQLVGAAIYPAVVVGLGLLISLFLLLFVVPRFARMYGDAAGQLSTATELVLALSRLLDQQMALVLAGLLSLLILATWAIRRASLGRIASAVVERVGPLRRQWDQFRMAKLYQSLALMFRGGYALDEALLVCEGLRLGARADAGIASARQMIAQGKPASVALESAGLTETVTARLLAVGERTGEFDAVLQTIAERHAEAFGTFVERATKVVEPLLLLVVALLVGGIVVMMYMPVFDIASSLGGSR